MRAAVNGPHYVSSVLLAARVPSAASPTARQPSHFKPPPEIQPDHHRKAFTDSDSRYSGD